MSEQNDLLKLDVNIVNNTSQKNQTVVTRGISGAYTGGFTTSPGITCSSGGSGGVGQGQKHLHS